MRPAGNPENPDGPAPGQAVHMLPWLRRLRWTAVAGQSATVLYVVQGLGVALPLGPVFAVVGVLALSNLFLHRVPPGAMETPPAIAAVLGWDVVLLTVLLHLCGGAHNPFTSFYLVQVALAAVALPPVWTAGIAGLCSVGFGMLYLGRRFLPTPGEAICGVGPSLPLDLHLKGMLTSFVLTAAGVAFFAGRLQQQLRRQAAELAAARSRAAQNERFAALATLAAGAAHELGTPLGTIAIAAGELARESRSLPGHPEIREDAELIREEAARCRAILDRLESQVGDTIRPVPVAGLAEGLHRRFPGPSLQVDLTGAPDTVDAPPEALAQALTSLVRNAFDASPAGGVVRLSVRADGDGVEFEVLDRGSGLSEEVREHAGEPFFTTKPAGQGMGLGLFLVKLLAGRLEGDFRLECHADGGTRARLRLPRRNP